VQLFYGDGLGKVAGLVHVAATPNGNMVREQLQRNNLQKRGDQIGSRGNFDYVIGGFASQLVSLRYDGDDDTIARFHFLEIRNGLLIEEH
jgi:hypothetical protein